jgi:hypothetical protein
MEWTNENSKECHLWNALNIGEKSKTKIRNETPLKEITEIAKEGRSGLHC